MEKLILLLSIFASLSQVDSKCCPPDVWTTTTVANVAEIAGDTTLYFTIKQNFARDLPSKMLTVEEIMYTDIGTAYSMKIIEDFNKMKMYIITGLSCTISNIPEGYHLEECIPDDAVLIGVDKAPIDGVSVDIETWSWFIDENGLRGNTTASVLADDCRFVSELFMGEITTLDPPLKNVMSTIFADFTYGVSQRERYFTIPIYCLDQEESQPAPTPLYHGRRGWFADRPYLP